MQGKKDYNEKLFMNFQLSDRIPAENFYRKLKEELDLGFLRKTTRKYYGLEGQSSIDPVVFFKLILIGYLENLNSDRKIMAHAGMRMDMLYFIGYDIDEALPWHSTISRTRQLFGEEVFRALFKEVLRLCVNKGMVNGKRQAIDSAYIKANASMDSLIEKQVIQDADSYMDGLHEEEEENKTVSAAKKREVEGHHQWKTKEYKDQHKGNTNKDRDLDEYGNTIRPRFLSNHTHYSKTDPDARISVKPGKPRQLNYTAQTVVDTSSHVITTIMADYSDKRDSQSLAKAIDQAQENLREHDLHIEEVLADTGYSSGEALKYLNKQNIEGYIPNFGQYKNTREGFVYNELLDRYECQLGNKASLTFKKISSYHGKNQMKRYSSSSKDCRNCPLRGTCIGKADFKSITETVDKALYDQMHERLQTAKARRMKKLRSSTVEPVLGTLINFTGMRRIWTRGIQQATKFMIGAAIAYNLKKWLKHAPKKNKIRAMIQEDLTKLKNNLFALLYLRSNSPECLIHRMLSINRGCHYLAE
ncbi:MAG: transposase [Sphingobacteriales bacterium]|nr:transposase [Sphingobacteriales bacterium]